MNLVHRCDLKSASDNFLTLDNRVFTNLVFELTNFHLCCPDHFDFRGWSEQFPGKQG